mgnify:FL=1|jgi:negative regulator of flagellin synthesis FlgM
MKITHNKVGQNLNTNDSAKTEQTSAAKTNGAKNQNAAANALISSDLGATKIDLSPRAQEMKKAKEVAMAAPDIDEAKVARLQKMIDGGTYSVNAKDIADKMVDDHLDWN